MADVPTASQPGDIDLAAEPTDYGQIADVIIGRISSNLTGDFLSDLLASALLKAAHGLVKGVGEVAKDIGAYGGKALVDAEDTLTPVFAAFIAPILANMFGLDPDEASFSARANTGARNAMSKSVVDAFLTTIRGDSDGPVSPDEHAADALAQMSVHAAVEGWFNAFIAQMLGDVLPIDWLRLRDMTELPDEVLRSLGIGRLVRRAITPLMNATVVKPLTWATNKKYRPELISPDVIVWQFLRGQWDRGDVVELLARHGYTDDMIDALIAHATKRTGPEDLAELAWRDYGNLDPYVAGMTDQGWDAQEASKHLNNQLIKREDALDREVVAAAVTAFVEQRIDEPSFDFLLGHYVRADHERAVVKDIAVAKATLHLKKLSPAEAEACVLAKIVPIGEYEGALRRAGYDDASVDALEMLLRSKIDEKATADQHREQVAAARAAAAKARADAAVERKATIDAARALRRQGSIAELEHAVITGLIPIARLQQVLTLDYDGDTVQIIMADIEAKRLAYVAKQEKAANAAKAVVNKGLSIGELTSAVLDGVLTVDQVTGLLTGRGLAPADVDVLAQTLTVKKADHDAAVAKRNHAAGTAKTRNINLARMEALVLLGARTLSDYDQLLAGLGYDDASRAAMGQLLQLKQQKASAATSTRAGVSAASPAKGLSLTQFRRAVIAGAKTLDAFQTFLVDSGYTSDAVATLTSELADDVTAADAARTRRAATASVTDTHALPLSALTRAARLSLITPAAYEAELVARGYSSDDVTLELSLLTSEIATAAATRKALPATAAGATVKGLSLGELAQLVKGGHKTVDDYQTRALAMGYSGDDAAALAALLADEVAVLNVTDKRHVQITGDLAARSLSLAELEAAVKGGQQTLDQYEQWLTGNGYGAADAALLRALLEAKLPAAAPASGGA